MASQKEGDAAIERLIELLLAVQCSELDGIYFDDVDKDHKKSWFEVRDEFLATIR